MLLTSSLSAAELGEIELDEEQVAVEVEIYFSGTEVAGARGLSLNWDNADLSTWGPLTASKQSFYA